MSVKSIIKVARSQKGVVAIEYALVAAGVAAIVLTFFSGNNTGLTDVLNALFAKIKSAAGV